MEHSQLMVQRLQQAEASDITSIERQICRLERESRRIPSSSIQQSPSSPNLEQGSSPLSPLALHAELCNTKEEIADLRRQIQQITQADLDSQALSAHSRQSTTEHHHHHYYYHVPEISQPVEGHETPLPARFFPELPTPPQSASSISSLSVQYERLSSSLSVWPQVDAEIDPESPSVPRDMSQGGIATLTPHPSFLNVIGTPTLKRSTSHESILDSTSTPCRRISLIDRSPSSSPLTSSSVTSSPTYLSASADLRQNRTSPLLLLSSARGKQYHALSSRKSFWNLWERSSASPRSASRRTLSSVKNVRSNTDLRKSVVVCTEVDIGMLQDALDG